MASLPSELCVYILQLRTDLCYQICREVWQRDWRENIAVVNEEYHLCKRDWSGICGAGIPEGFEMWNHRNLQNPVPFGLFDKLHIFRFDAKCGSSRSNFPRMYYCYSLRPEFEYKDWFLRFLESKQI